MTTLCQSACQALCSWAYCRCSHRWFAMRGIQYKGILARSPQCIRHRRIDKADISTPVAVECAANGLEEAAQSFTTMQNKCQLSRTFHHPLPVFKFFSAHWSTASKLASHWNCSATHKLQLHYRKILLEGQQSSRLISLSCWNFSSRHWGILRSH